MRNKTGKPRGISGSLPVRSESKVSSIWALAEEDRPLSPHLRSRHEVGRTLRESGVPTTEFRASIIIGSGSRSFKMIRALVERLPVMVLACVFRQNFEISQLGDGRAACTARISSTR